MRLNYAIKFVSDMDSAVAFYRDTLGLPLLFQSPFWSEFETGQTKLALHPADARNPAGSAEVGLRADDLHAFYDRRDALGVTFIDAPHQEHGTWLARIQDSEGGAISLSG